MQVFVGTSGYNYPEWRGSFYPEKFSTDKMLAYYAERFRTVEINYTFYRMPNEKLLSGWAAGTPEGFSFTLKAPRRITHDTKLQHCEELLHSFCRLPLPSGRSSRRCSFSSRRPSRRMRRSCARSRSSSPKGRAPRSSSVTRHGSTGISSRSCARAISPVHCRQREDEHAGGDDADYAYFRLRDEGYQPADLSAGPAIVGGLPNLTDAFVYFKHEEQGLGPEFARRFIERLPEAVRVI